MTLERNGIVERLKKFFSPDVYVNKGRNHKTLTPKQYWKDLDELSSVYPSKKSLYVEFRHIAAYDQELADSLLNNPDEWLEAATEAISELVFSFHELPDINVRVTGLPQTSEISISALRGEHLDKFLSIKCIISKASEVRPAYQKVAFRCLRCGYITEVYQDKDSDALIQPYVCDNTTCGKKGPFNRVNNESEKYDHQYLRIQEPLESLRGKQPEFLNVSCSWDIAGIVNAGDRVIITGILKGRPKTIKDGLSKYLDFVFIANAIEKSGSDYEDIEITPEDIKQIKQMARDGTLKDKIVGSVAPSLHGMEDVKLGIALQLFGGMPVDMPDGTRKRGDIHILMVGDPGVAKSQLLEFVAKFAPRAISFSGRSSSEAGLTGAAVKDELDGKWWIQPGALTLADGGICCADEVDKMKSGTLGSIHEALEQQMVHINKVVKADLYTRTAFLGAANPKYGRYDKYGSISEQITHGDAFISRMDLVFVLMDISETSKDQKLATHILGMLRGKAEVCAPQMDLELFRKCIAYAKTHVFPVLTDEAQELIIRFFVDTRGAAKTNTIPITARTLEATFRLATAHARMRLSETITEEDANAAINLLKDNLKKVGIDPKTGELDADILNGGTTLSQRNKIKELKDIITELSKRELARYQAASKADLLLRCGDIDIDEMNDLLKKMKHRGDIFCPEEGYYKIAK